MRRPRRAIFQDMSRPPAGTGAGALSPEEAEGRLRRFFDTAGPRGVVSVYLFGSTVRDSPNREKDVDVGVLLDRAIYPTKASRSKLRVSLTGDLMAELGTNRVDVAVLNDASPELGRSVIRTGRRVAVSDPEADRAFVRDVQLRAADLDLFLRRMRKIKLEALAR